MNLPLTCSSSVPKFPGVSHSGTCSAQCTASVVLEGKRENSVQGVMRPSNGAVLRGDLFRIEVISALFTLQVVQLNS